MPIDTLILRARRFFGGVEVCAQRIFAERFEAIEPVARRTSRLDKRSHSHSALGYLSPSITKGNIIV
jgi:hypothetical protein